MSSGKMWSIDQRQHPVDKSVFLDRVRMQATFIVWHPAGSSLPANLSASEQHKDEHQG